MHVKSLTFTEERTLFIKRQGERGNSTVCGRFVGAIEPLSLLWKMREFVFSEVAYGNSLLRCKNTESYESIPSKIEA